MVVAGDTIFIAGPIQVDDTRSGSLVLADGAAALEAWKGKHGSLLWAVSKKNGKRLAEQRLDSAPVWDSMAAVQGRLFLTTQDGNVLCFGG